MYLASACMLLFVISYLLMLLFVYVQKLTSILDVLFLVYFTNNKSAKASQSS